MKKLSLLLAGLLLLPALASAKTEPTKPDAVIEVRLDARGAPDEIKIRHLASHVSKARAERAIRNLAFDGKQPGTTLTVSLSTEQIDTLVGSPFSSKEWPTREFKFPQGRDREPRSVPRT